MLFRDCTLLNETECQGIEQLFNIRLSRETTPVPFDDGMYDVPTLKIDFVYDSGRAQLLLHDDWLSANLSSLKPNEVKWVWQDAREGQSKFHVKHLPHICMTSIEADKLGADEVVILTTIPSQGKYLFFKDTTQRNISIVPPFAQFPVSKKIFTPEELASLPGPVAEPMAEVAVESDYDRFKKLLDSVGQKYTTATLHEGEAEQKGYRKNIVYGIALLPPKEDPPRVQLPYWQSLDAYTAAFYFDREGKYAGTCTLPT